MRDFLEVFKYTFKENIKKKAFIISTIVILVLVIGVMLIPAIVTEVQSKDDKIESSGKVVDKSIIYLIDNSGYFKDNLQDINKQFPGYELKIEEKDKIESLKSDIKDNGKSFLIVANMESDALKFDCFTKQYDEGPSQSEISKAFKKIYSTDVLKLYNVPDATISKLFDDLLVNVNELGKSKWGGYFASIFIGMLLFLAIYFCGYGISMSVASEKTSRVMEILITSVKPSKIILGKTAGMGVLELFQILLIMFVGVVTYKLSFPTDFSLGGMKLELSAFTPFTLTMIIIYFILGYTLYSLMFAVVGATVSKTEDLNSAMMPMSFVSIISFYFSYGTFVVPDSTAAKIASFVPFTSPYSIPSRLISTTVPIWEILVSLCIIAVTNVIVGIMSIKLYSFAVLHYGDRLKLSTLFKISKEN